MLRIKKELHNISITSLGPLTEKSLSQDNKRIIQQSKSKTKSDNLDLKSEQIKKEIKEVKDKYLSMSFSQNQSLLSNSNNCSVQTQLIDEVKDENEISYYIVKNKRSIFHRLNKPNKGKEFISLKNEEKKQLTSIINPEIFNHSNDKEYNRFMKDMSEWKVKKIAEWKNIILF